MKTKKIISRKLFVNLFTLSLLILFSSCSSDDEAGNQMISFKVDLVKLSGVDTSGDGGGVLEVYGEIMTKLNAQGNEQTLWNIAQQDYIEIEEADFPINGSTTIAVSESELNSSSIITTANLTEYDSNANNSDDPIGNKNLTVALSSITSSSNFEILLNETQGHVVKLTFSITRL